MSIVPAPASAGIHTASPIRSPNLAGSFEAERRYPKVCLRFARGTEKFLKAALIGVDSCARPEKYRHNIEQLFTDLVKQDGRFQSLQTAMTALDCTVPGKDVRYKTMPASIAEFTERIG